MRSCYRRAVGALSRADLPAAWQPSDRYARLLTTITARALAPTRDQLTAEEFEALTGELVLDLRAAWEMAPDELAPAVRADWERAAAAIARARNFAREDLP
jgi:hypothetical protein